MRFLLCQAKLWLLTFSVAGAQVTSEFNSSLDSKISESLKNAGAPSVSVAVVQDGRTAYTKAFGMADLAQHRKAEPGTRYAVGSISKQFTAAAILLAQEEGKLSLDDTVSKFYPELTRASEITIRQLLSHTSGYEDYAPQDYIIPEWTKPTTPQAILERWAKKPLNFDPGTQWQYSNTNYVLAGEIFEKATGQKLVPFLRERIFNPLEMTSPGDCDNRSPGDASRYTRFALGPPRPVAGEGPGWYFAAGELCMTAGDLARWDVGFLQHRILSAKSYEQFTQEVKLKNGKPTHYALGLSIGDSSGTRTISHTGEVSGFLASNTVFPDKNAAVVVLSNEDGLNLIGPLSKDISTSLLQPASVHDKTHEASVRSILEALQQGRVDRTLFTSNASSYFTEQSLKDYKDSLAQLGRLQGLDLTQQQLRGGMTHLSYDAKFEKKKVSLNIYLTADGQFEQFLVEEQL